MQENDYIVLKLEKTIIDDPNNYFEIVSKTLVALGGDFQI